MGFDAFTLQPTEAELYCGLIITLSITPVGSGVGAGSGDALGAAGIGVGVDELGIVVTAGLDVDGFGVELGAVEGGGLGLVIV